jgi:hypothetical protein
MDRIKNRKCEVKFMGWYSYFVASEARDRVGALEELVLALEKQVQELEIEITKMKKRS